MSQVTVGQLCELFGQIAEGKITGEAIQELIERGQKIDFPRLFKKVICQTRQVAKKIPDPYERSKALATIAQAYTEVKDIEAACQVAEEIPDPYWRSEALAAIAQASHEVKDIEAACQVAEEIPDPYERSKALAAIAQALAVAMGK